ncbi:male-specific histamine-binding salivary protein-like [Ixodes scapularis]|uniref:male-specific histamine-binding salivary protein-like n=1 Tax=Ixodes scapularis TaxID=6945 RepID=UPI001A9DF58F|nr:male-specific histamine-binding salivary protein-like [Ixodes scapularis]
MYPTLLVFASLVAAIASVGSQGTSSDGSPVDAWKTVTLKDAFYLILRSYENDDGLGGTGKCVSIQLSEKNEGSKTTNSKMMYRDPQTNQMKEKIVTVKVSSEARDTVEISDGTCETSTTKCRFLYSDYGTCDVVTVLGTNEPKCELWVSAAVASGGDTSGNQNIAKCEEEYKKKCSDQKKYEIYDKATCSSQ